MREIWGGGGIGWIDVQVYVSSSYQVTKFFKLNDFPQNLIFLIPTMPGISKTSMVCSGCFLLLPFHLGIAYVEFFFNS